MNNIQVLKAIDVISKGGILAYPTEAVYGLGCDPDNSKALEKIIEIKKRDTKKGLILIGSSFSNFYNYVDLSQVTKDDMLFTEKYWPGFFTFIFPASNNVSKYIKGDYNSVAIRVSNHPFIVQLCSLLGKPIVSTSANFTGESPCTSFIEVKNILGNLVDYVVDGPTLGCLKPSQIIDLKTKKIVRY